MSHVQGMAANWELPPPPPPPPPPPARNIRKQT
jgi:hypothetical protein